MSITSKRWLKIRIGEYVMKSQDGWIGKIWKVFETILSWPYANWSNNVFPLTLLFLSKDKVAL